MRGYGALTGRLLSHAMLILLVVWAASALGADTGATDSDRRTNVIFIIADDLGWGDVGCYGNPEVDTPVLDGLAAAGVRLTDCYAPSPLCSPARAGFLTGRYNHRTGAVDVSSNRGVDRIELGERTIGDHFRSAGYATAYVGKWHSGLYNDDYLPQRRGFDRFIGFANGAHDFERWQLERRTAARAGRPETRQIVPHDGRHLSDVLSAEAATFVRERAAAGQPFMLVFAPAAIHPPLQAPQRLIDKYVTRLAGRGDQAVAITYAMIEQMDAGIGRLLATVDGAGLQERTLVIFTSDNGANLVWSGLVGQTGSRFHGPFRGTKGDVLEQGIRVPGIVAWPSVIPGGQVLQTPVHGCDWLPTMLAACRLRAEDESRPLDGLDLMPLFSGGPIGQLAERSLYFQRTRYTPVAHSNAAVRRGRWKLVWPPIPMTVAKDGVRDNVSYHRGLTHAHWEMPLDPELPGYDGVVPPAPQLFNLETDPGEARNLAADHPEIVARLAAGYDRWFTEVMAEWRVARARIVAQDGDSWRHRSPPDPRVLFRDEWLWKQVPGVDPRTADPLEVFTGFWSESQ